jgi:hypothetical protein
LLLALPLDGLANVGWFKRLTGGIVAATLRKSSILLTAHADKLEVADASVRNLDLLVEQMSGILSPFPGARGILGEDFLRNFDLLLDNRHRLLQLQQGPGIMEETLTGQHVPLHTRGSHPGGATENRLILAVNVPQLQAETLSFHLDSGACALILFSSAYRGPPRPPGVNVSIATVTDGSPAYKHQLTALSVGNISLGNVLVVSSPQTTTMDVDGLLPTILFHRIYISHSGGFAIFNPVTRFTKVTHWTSRREPKPMTLRIERSTRQRFTLFSLSGRLQAEQVGELKELLDRDYRNIILDLRALHCVIAATDVIGRQFRGQMQAIETRC